MVHHNTPMVCLIFSSEKALIMSALGVQEQEELSSVDSESTSTALVVEEQSELSSVDSGSSYHERLAHPTVISLQSKSKPDEPSVSPTTVTNAILDRNRYRYAKAELDLQLLMASLPPPEDTQDGPCCFPQGCYSSNESEMLVSDIPPHLYTPPPPSMMRRLGNWCRYPCAKQYLSWCGPMQRTGSRGPRWPISSCGHGTTPWQAVTTRVARMHSPTPTTSCPAQSASSSFGQVSNWLSFSHNNGSRSWSRPSLKTVDMLLGHH
ncbi:hypothetical protein PCANC_01724 [Puccinia coronata f. sp. avenae]|uniref:Uncharacterized protein n=2 Tax=Puccinia coronata f. sp. avenae TaxID=200324 RepID=A0A2N5W3L0_9BASI|nr:hypothetical protein PCANC_01724 [Puccinia coronata f. sp. avenae]